MIDYSLKLCYGIIVSDEKILELKEVLTDEVYDDLLDYYSMCINSWVGGDFFIGVMKYIPSSDSDFVYPISEFTVPSDDDEDLIKFKRFFTEHNLWKLIDWKPKLMLINFCY